LYDYAEKDAKQEQTCDRVHEDFSESPLSPWGSSYTKKEEWPEDVLTSPDVIVHCCIKYRIVINE
jgi:hypothetical protein